MEPELLLIIFIIIAILIVFIVINIVIVFLIVFFVVFLIIFFVAFLIVFLVICFSTLMEPLLNLGSIFCFCISVCFWCRSRLPAAATFQLLLFLETGHIRC